jgi:heat shock protein HtpX
MQAANRRKTIGLLMGMGALMWCVVYAALSYFGGTGAGIVPIAVGISLISVWGSYYGSDKLVLFNSRNNYCIRIAYAKSRSSHR